MARVDDRPNILLILTDEQRLSTMSCYGPTPCLTPNLDRLATESVVFERAYTSCPVCTPARGTIMTGLYPHNHGMTTNAGNVGCAVPEIPDSPILLSRTLERAGYRLGYTGKWHLGTNPEERKVAHFDTYAARRGAGAKENPYRLPDEYRFRHTLPKDVGFAGQNFAGHGGGGFKYPEYHQYLADHGWRHEVAHTGARGPQRTGILKGPRESTVPHFLTSHTIELLDRFSGRGNRAPANAAARETARQPFFIWHNFWGPHAPYYVTEEYLDQYQNVEIPEWPNYRWPAGTTAGPHQMMIRPVAKEMAWADWEEYIRYYYAFVSMIDAEIGRLINALQERGLLENTVVIFAADHGEALGSHGGMYNKGQSHFEEIQRIPMLIRLPETAGSAGTGAKGTAGHAKVNKLVGLCDLYPTICDLAGAEYESERGDGDSLLPLLAADSAPAPGAPIQWRESIGIEYHGVGNSLQTMRTIVKGRIKYGFSYGTSEELYDLEADPYETNNLVGNTAWRETKREMREELVNWMRATNDAGLIGFYTDYVGLVE